MQPVGARLLIAGIWAFDNAAMKDPYAELEGIWARFVDGDRSNTENDILTGQGFPSGFLPTTSNSFFSSTGTKLRGSGCAPEETLLERPAFRALRVPGSMS